MGQEILQFIVVTVVVIAAIQYGRTCEKQRWFTGAREGRRVEAKGILYHVRQETYGGSQK